MTQQLYASWVHGNAAVAEDSSVTVLRQGFGSTFNVPVPSQYGVVEFHWIHIPIPTPVIMGVTGRLKLHRVLYSFNSVELSVEAIHLFDGASLILADDSPSISGDHIESPATYNGGNPIGIGHLMKFGLGLTFKVRTVVRSTVASENHPRPFFLAGAGADFHSQTN